MNNKYFTIDDSTYVINSKVYAYLKDYLYSKENIKWVDTEHPHLIYGVKYNSESTKTIKRYTSNFLSNSEIGEKRIVDLELEPQ